MAETKKQFVIRNPQSVLQYRHLFIYPNNLTSTVVTLLEDSQQWSFQNSVDYSLKKRNIYTVNRNENKKRQEHDQKDRSEYKQPNSGVHKNESIQNH